MITLVVALGLVACGEDSTPETRSVEAMERVKGPKPRIPRGPTSEKLIVKDLIEGTGAEAEEGNLLSVHYVAGIYETGDEIESAWVPGQPLGFQLGSGDWLTGFEEGMPGMRVGGRRELVIPATPANSPPGSRQGDTLVYVVDLVEVR